MASELLANLNFKKLIRYAARMHESMTKDQC